MTDERLREVLDRQEIEDRMHDYCYWVDRNRPDRQVEVFTEGCRVRYGRGPEVVGKEAFVAAVEAALSRFSATHHQVSNIDIRFTSTDTADAVSYVHAWHRIASDGTSFDLYAQYHDTWVRTEEGWRCSSRFLRTAGSVPHRDDLEGIGRE